jgi:hypothetical protein
MTQSLQELARLPSDLNHFVAQRYREAQRRNRPENTTGSHRGLPVDCVFYCDEAAE